MPAINAGIDSQTDADDLATGQGVLMNPFTGPAGSPFDNDQSGNASTGALVTGIGFGTNRKGTDDSNVDYIPGITKPDGTSASDATLLAIGGGHSDAADGGEAATTPYDEQPLMAFGLGGERDSGLEPVSTGYQAKILQAAGSVSAGGTISGTFYNNTGFALVEGDVVLATAISAFTDVTPDYVVPTIATGDLEPAVSAPDTAVATYTSATSNVGWSIVGGADAELFEINADGELSFIDASVANTYEVIIRVSEQVGGGGRDYLITVTVS